MKNTGDSKVQQRRERVLDQIRQAIWSMRSSRDIEQVTVMVGKSLNDLGVSFNYCSVNVIGDER